MFLLKQPIRLNKYKEFSASIDGPIFFSSISPFFALMIPYSIRIIRTSLLSKSSMSSIKSSLKIFVPVKLAFCFFIFRVFRLVI